MILINTSISILKNINLKDENESKLVFLISQLQLLLTNKHGRRFNTSMLIHCFLLYLTSPNGYKRLQDLEILTLPTCKTLNFISSTWKCQSGEIDSNYFQIKGQGLNFFESHCFMMIDEVFIDKKVHLENGVLSGISIDNEVAASVAGKFKDVFCLVSLNQTKY